MRKRPKLSETQFDKWAESLKGWIEESVSPFENDTPKKQKWRKTRAANSFQYFCRTYLPHYFNCKFGDFHEEWDDLAEINDELVLIAAPREHAKSTFFTFAKPIYNIVFAKRFFQIVISDTNDQATGFTLAIRVELEQNPRLRHDFGDLMAAFGRRSTQWKKNDFLTSNGVRILARGHGEKVRGLKNREHRPDYVVIDDFENDKNVQNPRMVKDGIRWIKRAVLGSMGEGFTALMIGNLFHPKSVLSQLIAETDDEGKPLYVSRIYRCWLNHGKRNQTPLWPDRWSPARLQQKQRQMGTIDFNAEMMNLCADGESPFREEWIKYYARETLPSHLVVASFVDPSAKKGESTDYKALISVGLDREKMVFYVLHAWIRRATIGEMFSAAYLQHDTYGGQMGIEENMFKDFLHDAIANYARKAGFYLPWRPVHHSTNKEARIIGTLSYLVEHGKLLFCKGHSDQDLLVEQLIYLLNPTVNDDGPDALEGAVSLISRAGGGRIRTGHRRKTKEMLKGYR